MLSSRFPVPPGILLSDILPQARTIGAGDVSFHACVTDATQVRPGDLYVAVDGPEHDGHDGVSEALQRGAKAIVTERFLPIQTTQFVVDDSRMALALIGHALAGNPSRETQVIGVLDGMHTVASSMLASAVLERAGLPTGLANEAGSWDGGSPQSIPSPTGSSLAFAKWLAECHANQARYAVVGVTPTTVARRAFSATDISHLILTGLSPDRGVGQANPRRAAELLLGQTRRDGIVIYNRDDLLCRTIAEASSVPTLSFGMGGDADIRGEIIERYRGQQTLLIEGLGDFAAVQTKPFGQRFASFCLASAAMGVTLGIGLPQIAGAMEQVQTVPLWMEPIFGEQPFSVYLDQAWDPWSIRHCLKSLKGLVAGRVICVAASSAKLSSQERAILGRTIEVGADVQILTADPDSDIDDRRTSYHDTLDGFSEPSRAISVPDRARAVQTALQKAQANDVVLITGCQGAVGQRGTHSQDRQVVERWLAGDQRILPAMALTSIDHLEPLDKSLYE